MDQGSAPQRKKRLAAFVEAARQKRILARLNEGWADDEIARDEGLTGRRVRQIVDAGERPAGVGAGPGLCVGGPAPFTQFDVRSSSP
jgi:hypothetical protein